LPPGKIVSTLIEFSLKKNDV